MKALFADERIRFLIAGGAAAFLNWIVRFPLSMFMPYAAAVTVAMAIGMVAGFILYRNLVFQTATRPLWLQIRDFIGVNLVAAIVTVLVAVGLSNAPWWPDTSLDYVPGFSHLVGIALGAVVNFFGHKLFTFR
ncbi:MAG: GtrA family protein [Hyphomonas sp.]